MVLRKLLPLLAVALLAAFLSSSASAGAPRATAAKSCSTPKYPGSGYFTSLKVTSTSCSKGKSVMLAHYKCRRKHGVKGRCPSVSGYKCTEKRNSIPTEIDSVVTCKKGSRKVVYGYQQNT